MPDSQVSGFSQSEDPLKILKQRILPSVACDLEGS